MYYVVEGGTSVPNVKEVFSQYGAFAAIRKDGKVKAWGCGRDEKSKGSRYPCYKKDYGGSTPSNQDNAVVTQPLLLLGFIFLKMYGGW